MPITDQFHISLEARLAVVEAEVAGCRHDLRRLEDGTPRKEDIHTLTNTMRTLNGRLGTTEQTYSSLRAEVSAVRGRMWGVGAALMAGTGIITAIVLRLLGLQ